MRTCSIFYVQLWLPLLLVECHKYYKIYKNVYCLLWLKRLIVTTSFCLVYVLPSFLNHIMNNFIIDTDIGKVYCRLSIIDIISPQILNKECILGMQQPQIAMINIRIVKMFDINFFCLVSLFFGQTPNNAKLVRFNRIAHL